MMMVLDTCALLWYTLSPEDLSPLASKYCSRIPKDGAMISSISLWEIGIKVQKKKLEIGTSLEDYFARIKSYSPITVIPVDADLWLRNIQLEWEHRDPADRTIVATAMTSKCPLVTSDSTIASYYKDCIW
jgi:PIN domain nuclease of toxin-antitoxin system